MTEENILAYSMRVQDSRNGLAQSRDAVLEALAEVDMDANTRQRLLAALSEKAAAVIEKSWLWFGEKIGKVNAAILLFLIYYIILTPIAFLSRIGSKDPLMLKAPSKSNFILKTHKYTAKDLENPW